VFCVDLLKKLDTSKRLLYAFSRIRLRGFLVKKVLFFIALIAGVPAIGIGQVNQDWVARYDGAGNELDCAKAIAVDDSSNVYVTGYSWGSGSSYDYATIKYNSAGVEQWVVRYNSPEDSNDYAVSIALDRKGNVYVTGYSWGSYSTGYDYTTIKYNSAGIQEWIARYDGPGNGYDFATSMAIDSSGNVYVTGKSYGSDITYMDYATVKYDSAGIQEWVVRYDGPTTIYASFDEATSIAVDGQGNAFVTGYSPSDSGFDYASIKYNSAGVEQWVNRYNGDKKKSDYAAAIAVDGEGNVYVTGSSIGSGAPDFDYATIKYNSAGVEQWVARYDGPAHDQDEAFSIAVDGEGNVYVTGWSESVHSTSRFDYATIKYSQKTGIAELSKRPSTGYALEAVRPNPASGSVEILYSLPANIQARLSIYDVTGMMVKYFHVTNAARAARFEPRPSKPNQSLVASVIWDGRDSADKPVPAGIYFVRLDTPNFSATGKLVLVR
jgi:hypothetical protein